ncbi:hypothetical protein D770_10790 [Flammeovirgaceae bacterium 311]|nr:hypothetical protein D770_10790 [Flammeovirgaceae bacterium 311]
MFGAFLKYLTVYLSSMVKFIAGPLAGVATGLSFWESALFSILGMMTTVLLLTLLGPGIRLWVHKIIGRKRKLFTPNTRRFVKIWKRWGIFGVSFLTPLIFSPIGGALLVNTFSGDRQKIILSMLVSAVFWGLVLSGILHGSRSMLPEI